MNNQPRYLKPNVVLEPLINQWYAWGLLIPPHTLSLITTKWHIPVMESYLKAPKMHAAAVKNPAMLGGPFIDLPGSGPAQVKALLSETRAQNQDLLTMTKDIEALDNMMLEAKGDSLEGLYEQIPASLSGMVELGYDLQNRASARYIEALLYQGSTYRKDRQSIRLTAINSDERPFALSTPRFPDAQNLHYPIAFDDPVIDRLFRMRRTPAPLSEIEALIPQDAAHRAAFESFFTDTPPPPPPQDVQGDQIRVRYYGHATLLVESANCTILTDPVIAYGLESSKVPRFTYEDLPETIDYAVLTHNHQDHVMFETLLQLRHRIKHIVVPRANGGTLQDPSLRLILEQTGFHNIIELDEMERLPIADGAITGLPFFGEHGDLHIRSKLAFHIDLNGRTLICAADSNNLSPHTYTMIHRALGPIDRLFIGMECEGAPMSWLYGPLMSKPLERRFDQARRLNGSDAIKAQAIVQTLQPKETYVYAMGQEPWLTFVSSIRYTERSKPIVESNALIEACKLKNIPAKRLYGQEEIAW